MKTKDALLNLSPWSEDVGAKAVLQKAWVRLRNILAEKRNEAHVAFVGSLVGITLEIDLSTLHRPEYVRILLGCRDVERIPTKAEGCLGDKFYDFFFELDKVVVGGSPKDSTSITVSRADGRSTPNKRTRTDGNLSSVATSSEDQMLSGYNASNSVGHGKAYAPGLGTVSEESEEDSSEEQGLLIDEIIQEKKMLRCLRMTKKN